MISSREIAHKFYEFTIFIDYMLSTKKSISFHELLNKPTFMKSPNPIHILINMLIQQTSNENIKFNDILKFLPDIYDTRNNQISISLKYPKSVGSMMPLFYCDAIKFINENLDINGFITFDDLIYRKHKPQLLIYNPLRTYLNGTKTLLENFLVLLPSCYVIGCGKIMYSNIINFKQLQKLLIHSSISDETKDTEIFFDPFNETENQFGSFDFLGKQTILIIDDDEDDNHIEINMEQVD